MIRVLLVHDHKLVRESLHIMLESDGDIQVVAECGDSETAMKMAREFSPDVIVMDVALPGYSGIETTQQLIARNPDVKVLALSTYLDLHIMQKMFDAGATGYVVKSAAGFELKQGISNVFQGRSYLCSEMAALVADSLRAPLIPTGANDRRVISPDRRLLSKRETEIARLLAEGRSGPEIGLQLNISSRTVAVHRHNLMQKLGLHSVVDLTRYAIRTGMLRP